MRLRLRALALNPTPQPPLPPLCIAPPCANCTVVTATRICAISGKAGPLSYFNPCYAVCDGIKPTRPYYLGESLQCCMASL